MDQRRALLAGAEQVHKFVRDSIETNDRMNEKVLMYKSLLRTFIQAYSGVTLYHVMYNNLLVCNVYSCSICYSLCVSYTTKQVISTITLLSVVYIHT